MKYSLAVLALSLLATSPLRGEERKHTEDPLAKVLELFTGEKAILIDVRELKEWQRGHVRGAMHVPLSELAEKENDAAYLAELAKKLPKDKPIYVHCAAGKRCLSACDVFEQLEGFDFRPLKPGYKDLIGAGFENATGDER